MKPCIRIDSPLNGNERNRLSFGVHGEILCATTIHQVRSVLLEAEARALAGAWVVGMVNYEAAPAFDTAMKIHGGSEQPLAWFGVFEAPASPDRPDFPNCLPCDWQSNTSREHYYANI